MEINVTYSDEDQKRLDEATNVLKEYDEMLLSSIKTERTASMIIMDKPDLDRFLQDPYRKLIMDHIVKLHELMLPKITMVMDKDEYQRRTERTKRHERFIQKGEMI